MFCNKCGNKINEGASFCPNCGNPITPQPPIPTPIKPKSSNKKLWIILGITGGVLLIAIVVAIIIAVNINNKPKSNSDYDEPIPAVSTDDADNTNDSNVVKVTDSNTFAYKGYNFTILPGFKYEIDSYDELYITSSSQALVSVVMNGASLSAVRANYSDIVAAMAQDGKTLDNYQEGTFSGVPMLYARCTLDNGYTGYAIFNSASSSSVFLTFVMNSSYSPSQDDLELVGRVFKNSDISSATFAPSPDDNTSISELDFTFNTPTFNN